MLDFFSTSLRGRSVCPKQILTSFHVCCRTLDTPVLKEIAVLDYPSMQLHVTFGGDATVRGKG